MQECIVWSLHTCACERLFICLPHNINYPFRKMIRKQQTFQLKLLHNPYISLIIVVGGLFAPRTRKSACGQRQRKREIQRDAEQEKTCKKYSFQFLVLIAAEKPSVFQVFFCNKMLNFIHVGSFLKPSPIFVLPKMDSGILIFLFITQFSVFHSLLVCDSVFFLLFISGLSIFFYVNSFPFVVVAISFRRNILFHSILLSVFNATYALSQFLSTTILIRIFFVCVCPHLLNSNVQFISFNFIMIAPFHFALLLYYCYAKN